ncbi:MAG: DNA-binding protein [Clostridia bacterium]|nr:DNA-binding protein [Clostridia bacterium]
MQEEITRKVELAWLMAFYGPLLTEKQREVLTLHCEEDMSLGEIAETAGVSRQAVHEMIARAADRMLETERRLHLAARFQEMERGLTRCRELLLADDRAGALTLLDELIRLEQEESNGL